MNVTNNRTGSKIARIILNMCAHHVVKNFKTNKKTTLWLHVDHKKAANFFHCRNHR